MQKIKEVQDVKEMEITVQDRNQEANEKFTEISSIKREKMNISKRKKSPRLMKQE